MAKHTLSIQYGKADPVYRIRQSIPRLYNMAKHTMSIQYGKANHVHTLQQSIPCPYIIAKHTLSIQYGKEDPAYTVWQRRPCLYSMAKQTLPIQYGKADPVYTTTNLTPEWLLTFYNKVQTHKRLKRALFLRKKQTMQISGVSPHFMCVCVLFCSLKKGLTPPNLHDAFCHKK